MKIYWRFKMNDEQRRYEVFGFEGAYAIRDNVLEQRTENRFTKVYANTLAAKLEKSLIIDRKFLADDIETIESEMNEEKSKCKHCHGTGKEYGTYCGMCNGTGLQIDATFF